MPISTFTKKDVKKNIEKSQTRTTQPNLHPENFSQIAIQDLLAECSPYAAITPLLTPDNAMYYAIQRTITRGTTVQLPYVVNSKVLHLHKHYTRDVSGQVLQSSPYTVIDGMCMTAMQMYNRVGIQHPAKVNSRVLAQSYILHTSLCVALSANGDIRIITASPAILSHLPLRRHNIDVVKSRLDMHNDDLRSGVLTCAELIPAITGYDVRPTTIHADRDNVMILPKIWADTFVDYVYDKLTSNPCGITIATPSGEDITISASLRKNHEDTKYTIAERYVDNSTGRYGYIRCVNADNNSISVFPLTHLVNIEMSK